ncbi:hypothetical protein Tco_1028057 [Tanacetum coccineum]
MSSTRHKGKEIAKPVTPQSESVSEEDSDPEQAQRDKDMQKNLALLANFMAKIQEVLLEESISTEQPLYTECADERVVLANLIANLTLDTEENKTILKQLKKANASLTQELEECKTNLDETSRAFCGI